MKVKGKRVLKNGAVAGYVYYNKDKKWKWRIIGRVKKGGSGKGKSKIALSNLPNNNQIVLSWNEEKNHLNLIINKQLRKRNVSNEKKNRLKEIKIMLNERHNNPNFNNSNNLNETFGKIEVVLPNGINRQNMNKLVELRTERRKNNMEMQRLINLDLNNNENTALNQIQEFTNSLRNNTLSNLNNNKNIAEYFNGSNITNEELQKYLNELNNELNNENSGGKK
jgi:hypothetical protein